MSVLRLGFASWCRTNRLRLRLTQQELATRARISRGYLAKIEAGSADPTIGVVERIASSLEVDVLWWLREPIIHGDVHTVDDQHARCSMYARRRLTEAGLLVSPEVEIVHGRSHGWIDLLAFDPIERVLVIVEVKTQIDDLGAIERQIGWYERSAMEAARRLGWEPKAITTWLLVLATTEADAVIQRHHELFGAAFPARAPAAMDWLRGMGSLPNGRVLAMIDPASHRRDWLIRTRRDGRRSRAPYVDPADADRR